MLSLYKTRCEFYIAIVLGTGKLKNKRESLYKIQKKLFGSQDGIVKTELRTKRTLQEAASNTDS